MSNGDAGSLIGQTLGGYRLTSLLGVGGMAEVYRGEDQKLGRAVAVKVLPRTLAADPEYVRRFRAEATSVSSLDHPNVVKVFAYGEERGLLYLVMPLLVESLREKIEREGLLPLSDSARLVVQIAAALDAAHAQGIVHRDVKPENILLNAQGRALLTDFGIARDEEFLRATGSNRTLASTGLPVGTPEYMAPEQLRGAGGDARIDGYSLGVVLYELLAGSPPFAANTPYEVASLVLGGKFTPPSEINPLIWPALEHVVLRAMALDPDDRYPDMRSFALALREAVLRREGQSPAARRATNALRPDAETMPLGAGLAGGFDTPDLAARTEAMRPTWRLGVREGPSRSGRSVFLAAAGIALVLVLACVLSGFAVLHGLTSPGSAVNYGTPGNSVRTATHTGANPTATATQYTGPGVTPYPTFTPGGPPTPTAFGTPGTTPSPQPTATQPSGDGTPTLQLGKITIHRNHSNICSTTGPQSMKNTSGFSVSWAWSVASISSSGMSYSFNFASYNQSGLPQQSGMGDGTQESLYVRFPCTSGTTYTVHVNVRDDSDPSNKNSYTFTMQPN